MSIRSGFFTSINNDRLYTAEDFNKIFSGIISPGIFKNYGGEFEPSFSSSNIIIKSGRAWLDDIWIENDTDESIDLSLTNGDYYLVIILNKSSRSAQFSAVSTNNIPDNGYIICRFSFYSGAVTSLEDLRDVEIGYASIMGGDDYISVNGGTVQGNLVVSNGKIEVGGELFIYGSARHGGIISLSGLGVNYGPELPTNPVENQAFVLIPQDTV